MASNAMEEAFRRVGIGRPQRSVVLTLPRSAPIPLPRREDNGPLKHRLIEDRDSLAAMSDDELRFEEIFLVQNIETAKADLSADRAGDLSREPGWRKRAQWAVAMLKARLSLCRAEMQKRETEANRLRAQEEDTHRLERHQRHQAHLKVMADAATQKQMRIASKDAAFVKYAKTMMPREMWLAIWAAVNGDEPND